MTPTEVFEQLKELAAVKPRLRGLMNMQTGDPPQYVGLRWAAILADESKTKQAFLPDVLGEYVDRERMVPEPLDNLLDVVQCEANSRYWRAWERHQQHQKYHQPRPQRDDKDGRFFALLDLIYRQPKDWQTKTQAFTNEQIDEALGWVNGRGERPEWLTI